VEEKPEVRKAGGVYYTPTYIVDYIVKNTVGKLLGPGIGAQGSRKGEFYGDSDISGPGSLAGSNESDNRCVSSYKGIPKGRALRIDEPDTACGSVSACQHSGGTQPKIEKGVSSSCFDCPGLSVGAGNSFDDCQTAGISFTAGHGENMGSCAESGANAKRSHSVSQTPDPRSLTPKEVSKIRILDPACGSGSFLLGAYQYLIDWHRDWYVNNDPQKWATGKKPALYQAQGGDWHLTTAEKKRILLNNIYGVDIDSQAVEVTKLSLLLKVLEGENNQTLERQLKFFHERALPDLGDNIKCGNSLIGPDFYEQQTMLDDEERYRINVFDWHAEFPEIMKRGGFDAVIGNPPYLRIQGLQEHYRDQIDYFLNYYQSALKRFDLYLLFVEKGFKLLTTGGYLGYICPHKFTNSDFGSGLRSFLAKNAAINALVSFGNNLVFKAASTYTGILILSKNQNAYLGYYEFPTKPITEISEQLFSLDKNDFTLYPLSNLGGAPWVLTNSTVDKILTRIRQPNTLGDIFEEILVGVQSGIDNIHVLKFISDKSKNIIKLFSEKANDTIEIEREIVKPFLTGEDVHKFSVLAPKYYCIYPYKLENDKTMIIEERELKIKFPLAYAYLNQYKKELTEIRMRQKTNTTYWYSCHRSRDMRVFESDRILTPEISFGCNMTIGAKGLYHNTQVYSLVPKKSLSENILYWLGLLNSQLLWYFMKNTGTVLRGGYVRFKTEYLKPFPVKSINFSDPADKARHDKMVSLVEQMLSLNKKLTAAKTDHEKTSLQRQIDAIDKQIDQLVYELYGLTEEEIGIVENM
jgi:hypothetical protein